MDQFVTTNLRNIDYLWMMLTERLAAPGYAVAYATESEFEAEVWTRVINLATEIGLNVDKACLTSHVKRAHRSAVAWMEFCVEATGPDVTFFGSNNRLDIVFRHQVYGSIGIEVKCLGASGHAGKLTQGLGQAVLALAHRNRTLLVIHCGTVSTDERERLRTIGAKISGGTRMAMVVVP
jgi:hypothetical protein